MKVTNVEERCVKADRRLPSNETNIIRNYGLILARGYVLIFLIIYVDTPSRKIWQQLYFHSLPLCRGGWGRWSPISLHGLCCISIWHPIQKNELLLTLKGHFFTFKLAVLASNAFRIRGSTLQSQWPLYCKFCPQVVICGTCFIVTPRWDSNGKLGNIVLSNKHDQSKVWTHPRC